MEVSIDKEIIISAIAANYNISELAVDLSKYSNRQILESLEYYLRYRNGRLLWNRDSIGGLMKAVYIHKIITKLNINGEWETVDNKFIGGRYIYKYGEIPENYTEKFDNEKTVFYDFAKRIGYTDDFKGSKTFWKKRVYLDLFPLGKGIVYKDSLKAVEIHHIYEVVDNPIIEYLEKDLGFKGYSELVFDREQELKNMMLKK